MDVSITGGFPETCGFYSSSCLLVKVCRALHVKGSANLSPAYNAFSQLQGLDVIKIISEYYYGLTNSNAVVVF